MSPAATLSSNLLNNHTSVTQTQKSGVKQCFHFTPIFPKRKLSVNSAVLNSGSGHSLGSSKKRYNRSNSINYTGTENAISIIKTSKKWVLPPRRPKPGRKALSKSIPPKSSDSLSSTSFFSTASSIFSNTNRKRTQSIPVIPYIKSDSNNNNNNTLNKTNLSKKNSSSYLEFLKLKGKPSLVSTNSAQRENAVIPVTSNNFLIVPSSGKNSTTSTTVSSAISTVSSTSTALQREVSSIKTMRTNLAGDIDVFFNKLNTFALNEESSSTLCNNSMSQNFSSKYDLNMASALLSSFASNPGPPNKLKEPANSDEFVEKTTNDELENEIYNNIWKLLSRYNKALSDESVSIDCDKKIDTNNNNKDDTEVPNNENGSSTVADVDDVGSYFYSAPSLEELMDKQDNRVRHLSNLNLTF